MTIRLNDHGDHIHANHVDDATALDHLPAGVYRLHDSISGRMFIRDRKRFEVPDRAYGEHMEHFRVITQGYDRLERNLGVAMIGVKGSGKSMLAERICNWGINLSMPVFRINEELTEEQLRFCIAISNGSCILYFDEFGKIYSKEKQEQLLSFLGDATLRGAILLFTANEREELSSFMLDRPGRCQYCIEFQGLQVKDGREVATAFALNQERTNMICRYVAYHLTVSYDIVTRLAQLMVDTPDTAKLTKLIEITNIPKLIYNFYELTDIYYDGERQQRENLKIVVGDDRLKLTIYDGKGQTLLEQTDIDLLNPNARHIDNEQPYPEGLMLGKHVLDTEAADGTKLRICFRRALAELEDRWDVSVPTEVQLTKIKAQTLKP